MTWGGLFPLVRDFWSVWLLALFLGIVVWAYWPGARQRRAMDDHAEIPFRDGADG